MFMLPVMLTARKLPCEKAWADVDKRQRFVADDDIAKHGQPHSILLVEGFLGLKYYRVSNFPSLVART